MTMLPLLLLAAVRYTGYVDSSSCAGISGWAADLARPNTPITVNLWDVGATPPVQIASTTANGSRSDVGAVIHDNGLHGFAFAAPVNGVQLTLQVRFESSTVQLANSPIVLRCGPIMIREIIAPKASGNYALSANPVGTVLLFRNGLLLAQCGPLTPVGPATPCNGDYRMAGSVVRFLGANETVDGKSTSPQVGDIIQAVYWAVSQ